MNYAFKKEVNGNFQDIEKKITEELKKNGFGVLSRIDIQKKFKEKLNIDYKKYIILGACSPPNAYKALEFDEDIGLLLPCNIVMYEKGNKIIVGVIKPTVAMSIVGKEELIPLAEHIEKELIYAVNRL